MALVNVDSWQLSLIYQSPLFLILIFLLEVRGQKIERKTYKRYALYAADRYIQ